MPQLHAFFIPRPLRFAINSPPSGTRHTKSKGLPVREAFTVRLEFCLEEILQTELDIARALNLCTNGAEGGNVGEIRSRRCEANVV